MSDENHEDTIDFKITKAVVEEFAKAGVELFPLGYVMVVRAAQPNTDGTFDREVSVTISHDGQSPFLTMGLLTAGMELLKHPVYTPAGALGEEEPSTD